MEGIDAWLLLTSDEQAVISSKLGIEDGNGEETHREVFNRIIGDRSVEEIKNMTTLVKNFIDSMGGRADSAIWREIKSFEGVWLGKDSDQVRNDPSFHEGGGSDVHRKGQSGVSRRAQGERIYDKHLV